ncbi:hypothetical protein C5S29_08395, partial [ANME-1 cluster archaeon GoMg3.2]|nr:hypothetical protein [ANME-1 cluster archaeon GoMg3.2]
KIPEMKEKAMLNGKLVKELLDSFNREGKEVLNDYKLS